MSTSEGLREIKKERTRRQIVSTAARLFAEHGYEQVTIGEVARAAEVSPQTIYNHFPGGKEDLVTDRDAFVQQRLSQLIRERPAGVNPAGAIRPLVMGNMASIAEIPPEEWRGEIGYLSLISPTVHRLSLEMTARQAAVATEAILASSTVTPEVARLQGMALAGVFQIVFTECGWRTRDRQPQVQVSQELSVIMAAVLDELERWFDA